MASRGSSRKWPLVRSRLKTANWATILKAHRPNVRGGMLAIGRYRSILYLGGKSTGSLCRSGSEARERQTHSTPTFRSELWACRVDIDRECNHVEQAQATRRLSVQGSVKR